MITFNFTKTKFRTTFIYMNWLSKRGIVVDECMLAYTYINGENNVLTIVAKWLEQQLVFVLVTICMLNKCYFHTKKMLNLNMIRFC